MVVGHYSIQIRALVLGLCALATSGCAALNTVHWKFGGPGESEVFTTDAMQRHLIMIKDENKQVVKVCAEASPDAMSVFSTALATRGNFSGVDKAAELGLGLGQTASTIERTQTINLLRESMYRTCERWLSGALTKNQFIVLAARDHRSMVAVLAIEQLTGVVKAPATIISGPAVSAARSMGEKTTELVESYRAERKAAQDEAKKAADAFAAINKPHADSQGGTKPLCDIAPPPEDAKDEYAKCAPAKAEKERTEALLTEAKKLELNVVTQLGDLNAGIAAAVQAATNEAGGLGSGDRRNGLSDAAFVLIAQEVKEIAMSSGINEALLLCAAFLSDASQDPSTIEICNGVIQRSAELDLGIKSQLAPPGFTLGAETMPQRSARTELMTGYTKARLGLLSAMMQTPDADWATNWKLFVDRTGFGAFTCASRSTCIARLADQRASPMSALYADNAPLLRDAIGEWEDRLKKQSTPVDREGDGQ